RPHTAILSLHDALPIYAVNGHAILRDVQAHAPDHIAVKTFPSFMPIRQLDHIFVSPHFAIHAVHSPANLLTRRASDHLPLVADRSEEHTSELQSRENLV